MRYRSSSSYGHQTIFTFTCQRHTLILRGCALCLWLDVLAIKKRTQKKKWSTHMKYTHSQHQTFVYVNSEHRKQTLARCIPHFIYENWVAVVKWSFSKRFIIVCRQFSCTVHCNTIFDLVWDALFFPSQNHKIISSMWWVCLVLGSGFVVSQRSSIGCVCFCFFFIFLHRFNLAFESCLSLFERILNETPTRIQASFSSCCECCCTTIS